MRDICAIIASILILCSCRGTFTGAIVYDTSIISNNGNKKLYEDYTKKYGDTLEIDYLPNGDMKRNHKNGLLDYQLYKAEDGAVYFKYHNLNIDTFPCINFSLEKIYKKKVDDEEIIGKKCTCYEILSTAKSNADSVLIKACYPKNKRGLFVKPKLYKTYKDYYVYELFKQNKTPYFKYHIHYPYISIKYDGVGLKEK